MTILIAMACKQTYIPPAVANPPNYLVVEGFINTNAGDSTVFRLSRTVRLDTNLYLPETGATVTVEGTDNSSWPLKEQTIGSYSAPLSTLNYNVSYRLHIVTAAGKQYASDYVTLVPCPPIDSISWRRLDYDPYKGVRIYANTHDPHNNTHYYRWSYQETWEFHSAFYATVRYIPGTGIVLYHPNTTDTCWKSFPSSSIVLASSTQLSQDLIHESPLVLIPLNAQQLSVRYSIQVTQYALTAAAFNWWQIMERNTEQIGSIFGVQPSANPGNIRCLTDSSEWVLGYVGGGTTRSQRIFITVDQVRPWFYDPGCPNIKTDSINTLDKLLAEGYWPWDVSSTAVYLSYPRCIDCTLTGTNIRPSFW